MNRPHCLENHADAYRRMFPPLPANNRHPTGASARAAFGMWAIQSIAKSVHGEDCTILTWRYP
jgi:hypothetical protein